MTYGLITGLAAEARIAAKLGLAVAGGGTPAGATQAAELLVAEGVSALVSFGVAGGLNPALPPGTLIIPARLVTENRTYITNEALTTSLGGPCHTLLAGTEIVATVAEKAALYRRTHADAVDLESGVVAAVALRNKLPFAAIRAIIDPATEPLPPAAIAALNAVGAIAAGELIGSILKYPGQIPALMRLAWHAGKAQDALRRHVRKLKKVSEEKT
jgi:adenosylhomocysteine nucleosidase